jgi:arginine N-succinyltransferase
MLFLRPSREDDLPGLMRLAGMTGAGFTSISPDKKRLRKLLAHSAASFADTLEAPEDAHYLFALEDSDSGHMAGVCGILAATGRVRPFYSYRVGLIVNTSPQLRISNAIRTLYLCNDYTGCAEIGSLFVDPAYRGRRAGRLLSRSRFLFMAEFRARFPSKVISEMRGVSDAQGYSPFWENLGKKFLEMPFTRADYLSGRDDNSFIAELMPRHPIYVPLLSPEAQAAIAQVHRDTVAARHILEGEGFRYQNYVDIFDAGPTLETRIDDIRTLARSRRLTARVSAQVANAKPWLLANTSCAGYRCLRAEAAVDQATGSVRLAAPAAKWLQVADGDPVRASAA